MIEEEFGNLLYLGHRASLGMEVKMETNFINQRVLITGENGFIGSHMVERMVKEKAQVSVIVRDSSDLWRLFIKNSRGKIKTLSC
jgi:FlaA1/EpsC-like NDP-sugar epimerase